jgi:hypothetical protein
MSEKQEVQIVMDHFLVMVNFKERLALVGNNKGCQRTKWETEAFKDPGKTRRYKDELSKKLDGAKLEHHGSVEDLWTEIKTAVQQVAKDTIGEKQASRNMEQFNAECRNAIEEKNKARQIFLQKGTRLSLEMYKHIRKSANKTVRKKKREYLKSKMREIKR